MDRTHRSVLAALLLCWGLVLGVQAMACDETEHCHVAWLIGHEHQQPIRDFFQHHQPVLWDVLQLYFRLGADGPEVLYFGRALVLICTALSALAFLLLPRRLANRDNQETPVPWFAGALALFPLIVFSLIFGNILVIRPETLSTPLFLYSLLLWLPDNRTSTQIRRITQTFLAGLLVGAAIYTSPRFVFLSPAFFFLPLNRSRLFELDFRRILILGGGALAFVVLYSGLMAHSLSEIVLNLEFARVLRPVGDGYFETAMPLLTLMLLLSLFLVFLCGFMTDQGKKRLLCQSIFGLCLLGIVLLADWPYMHAHHFLFLALWWGVMLATAVVEFRPECRPPIPSLVLIGAVGGIVLCLANVASDIVSATTIVDQVQLKRAILERIDKSDCILFVADFHPISALDASYYINPIGNYPGRLATAVRLAQASLPLPDCDYVGDIRAKRPALIDVSLLDCVGYAGQQAYKELLKDYKQILITANARSALRCFAYTLKAPAPGPRNQSPSMPTSGVTSVKPQQGRRVVLRPSSDRIGHSLQRIP